MAKVPVTRSSAQDIQSFLQKSRAISRVVGSQPRLLFAIDATASRQPTWDSASHLQREMFRATTQAATLSIQLCYYRGANGFFAGRWLSDSGQLARQMQQVHCEAGLTQIARTLRHALTEHRHAALRGVVFIGDAIEEHPDSLCQLAGECALHRLPLFLFQEGNDPHVRQVFGKMAQLSGGAYAHFDLNSAATLAGLLGAVARYATGGIAALEKHGSDSAKLLLRQIKP